MENIEEISGRSSSIDKNRKSHLDPVIFVNHMRQERHGRAKHTTAEQLREQEEDVLGQ